MKLVSKIVLGTILVLNFELTAQFALADTKPEVENRNLAHMEMFMTGQYQDLDREMNGIQAEFKKGIWSDVDLVTLMQTPFLTAEPAFEEKYKAWLKEYPSSYAAHQAQAYYYHGLAIQNLQGRKLDQLSPAELEDLKHHLNLAIAEDKAALNLDSKPFATYCHLTYLYALSREWKKSRQMLDVADKIAPKNTSARYPYVVALSQLDRPLSEINDFVEEVRKADVDKKYFTGFENILHWRLLHDGQYDRLDVEMNQVQRDYETGKIDDKVLNGYFQIFSNRDSTLESLYNVWVEAHPKSYAARQARAYFYSSIAAQARGNKYASETSRQEMSGMNHYLNLAFEDDKSSMSLTDKPILAVDEILLILQLVGNREAIDEMLALGNKIDPKNSIVRYSYMAALQTKWWGSLEDMEKFLDEVKTSGLPKSDTRDFEDLIIAEKIWLANRKADTYSKIGDMETGF